MCESNGKTIPESVENPEEEKEDKYPLVPAPVPSWLEGSLALARRYPMLRPVEFDLMPSVKSDGLVEGYGLEYGRIRWRPDGWHVYTVVETGETDDSCLSIMRAGDYPFARFDLVTLEDLDALVDAGRLDAIPLDDWGFTGDDAYAELHPDADGLDDAAAAWFDRVHAPAFTDDATGWLWLVGPRRRVLVDGDTFVAYTPLLDGWSKNEPVVDNTPTGALAHAWRTANTR